MGGAESQSQQSCQDLLADFTQTKRQNNGLVLADKKSDNTYFLKQFNFVSKKQYENQFKRLQGLQNLPHNQNILALVRLFSQTFNNICSNSYKIYALYQYPTITLDEEINARKKQEKYFDECELWSILQSCANAMSQLKPSLSLHPKNIFIVPDGVLKVINNEMMDEDYRCYLKQGVYYAPEKISQFKKSDNQNTLRKQSIFSLGMTLLHAALLTSVSDCYNYQNYEFIDDKLQAHIEQLVNGSIKSLRQSQKSQNPNQSQASMKGRYSQEFIEMLAMILQPNPNKRASLMEVHGMLNKVWSTQNDEQNTKNIQQQNNQNEIGSHSKKNFNETQHKQKNQSLNMTLKQSNRDRQGSNNQSSKKYTQKNTQTKQPSQASQMQRQNQIKANLASGMSSFNQSGRQSKPNINEYSSFGSNVNNSLNVNSSLAYVNANKFAAQPCESIPEILKSNQYPSYLTYVSPSPALNSVTNIPSVPNFMYGQNYGINYSSNSSLAPVSNSLGSDLNKQNGNLYTDPKLLQMIRKDLKDLNELKKSSMMNSYGVYSNPYIGTSSFHSSYADIGANMLSSKNSIGLQSSSNVQQIYTVKTQNSGTTQMRQVVVSSNYNQKTSTNPVNEQQKPQTPQVVSQPTQQVQACTQPQKVTQRQQGFSKNTNNTVYVVQQYQDGRKFEGTLINGVKEGHGKLIYSDGAYYQGNFKNDKMEGEGTLYYGPDRPAYQGSWVADQFHGFGILHNQSPIDLNGCFNYNDFNLIEDFWVRYEGNFDSDNKSGDGKLVLSNGQQFQGNFQNDCINGKGIFLTKDGQQITGVWQDNILVQLDA